MTSRRRTRPSKLVDPRAAAQLAMTAPTDMNAGERFGRAAAQLAVAKLEAATPKTGAAFARGASKQDYATPLDFFEAFIRRFGAPAFDLAASPHNTKAAAYYTEADDALSRSWPANRTAPPGRMLWLNPPYDRIAPWAEKCKLESRLGARIALLVPASVGASWFHDHVFNVARVLFLTPRLSFDGKHPYPKDCMLCLFGQRDNPLIEVWRWK